MHCTKPLYPPLPLAMGMECKAKRKAGSSLKLQIEGKWQKSALKDTFGRLRDCASFMHRARALPRVGGQLAAGCSTGWQPWPAIVALLSSHAMQLTQQLKVQRSGIWIYHGTETETETCASLNYQMFYASPTGQLGVACVFASALAKKFLFR